VVQKYLSQADKDRQVYLKALAAYEAEKKSGVSILCFYNSCMILAVACICLCNMSMN